MASLKEVFDTYRNLEDQRALAQEGIMSEYTEVATLYGEYRSEAMSDNAKKALVSLPVDTVTGMVDLSLIVAKASVGDEMAQQQMAMISDSILAFVEDPVGTVEQNVKSQLEEARRLRELGNINAAEEIESRVIMEGVFAFTATTGGAISLARVATKAINAPSAIANEPAPLREIVGVGADGSKIGLPKGYSYMTTANGEHVIQGPRGGIYTHSDYVDQYGNPLYKSVTSGKLYSLDNKSVHVQTENLSFVNIDSTKLEHVASSGASLIATTNKTTTVIGNYNLDMQYIIAELEYPESLDFDEKIGSFNLLNVPQEIFESPEQFWEDYNKPFLDKAIRRGDTLVLATKPEKNVLKNKRTGELTMFGREIMYLKKRGYKYNPETNTMMKVE